jgi:hypothetical protein
MPVDPVAIAFLTTIAAILVQAVKGLLSEPVKKFIPLALLVLMPLVGLGLALYQGADALKGVFEGFFAGASAVGLYETGNSLPGVGTVFSDNGWITRKQP